MTPVVLLHAFPLDATMYDAIREPLSHRRLITPNFPGFGARPVSSRAPSLDVFADDLVALLDRHDIGSAVIGGTSMGGYTTMAVARRHPDRIAGLLLIDTKASADTPDAAAGRRAMADRLVSEASSDVLLEQVFPKLLGQTTFSQRPDVVNDVRARVVSAPYRSAAWAQRAMANRHDSHDVLAQIKVPCLVIVGSEDVLAPPGDALAMTAVLQNAALVELPGVGHLTPLEAPKDVARAIDDFVASLG